MQGKVLPYYNNERNAIHWPKFFIWNVFREEVGSKSKIYNTSGTVTYIKPLEVSSIKAYTMNMKFQV